MIVPFPPGGATDITARVLSEPLAKILQQPVVIDNRAGAGGSIGMAEVARAAPDGLAFGVATLSTHGVNPAVYQKLPYDPIKGFVAVTELVKAPGVVVINPQVLPVKSFAELVKYLKANPGKVSYASPGNGTIGHMWGELFKSSTGTSMVHIPYRGAGPAINDVLAGEVPVYFDQVASSLPHVKAGKLKALAVSWSSRLDVLPEVPTYRELGYPANNDPVVVRSCGTRRHAGRRCAAHAAGRGHRAEGRLGARAAGAAGALCVGHHAGRVREADRQRDREDEEGRGLCSNPIGLTPGRLCILS